MITQTITLRTRYGETDRMGYVYYGNYAQYYEVARVELMRSAGISYAELEDSGIMMPVIDLQVKYIRPAYYDENLQITCMVKEKPGSRMKFEYQVFNSKNELINSGSTTLVFVNKSSGRPISCPEVILEKFNF